jgi:hypothetical protein
MKVGSTTEEEYFIGQLHYEIVLQSGKHGTYAVRLLDEHEERVWLKFPKSRYETLGGARSAILADLESRTESVIVSPRNEME